MDSVCYRRRMSLLLVLTLISLATAQVGASTCSLADHIRSANTNTSVGGCPQGTSHDVITITEDISLSEPLPPVTGTITIEGNGHTISGDGKFRIFEAIGGRLTINDLTLARGFAENGGAMRLRNGAQATLSNVHFDTNLATNGGAISMSDANVNLVVDRSSFVKNEADEYGGAIHAFRGTASITKSSFVENKGWYAGGAIYAINQSVTVANSTFAENLSDGGGGALDLVNGEFTLTHVTFVGNRSTIGTGNAINWISGNVYLRNSILEKGAFAVSRDECEGRLQQNVGNLSRDGSCLVKPIEDALLGELTGSPAYYPLLDFSPAVDAADPQFCLETDQIGTPRPQGGGCDVGALESTTARPAPDPLIPPPPCPLADQIIAANTDAPSGGCRAGSGADTIKLDRDITLASVLPAITSDITIEGNGHTISGDKRFRIFNVDGGKLTVNDLTLTEGSTLAYGGAIEVQNYGQLAINYSHFIDNSADLGGAVALQYSDSKLTINDSRFVGNHAKYAGGAIVNDGGAVAIRNSSFLENTSDVIGGAIYSFNRGTTDVSDSSFVGNWAKRGGAISSSDPATTNVSNSTFIGNRAPVGGAVYAGGVTTLTHVSISGGGLFVSEGDKLNLRNSIVNTGLSGDICRGELTQNVGNLISDGSCDPAYRGDPLFGERTVDPVYLPLQAGSPAINAAHPAFCTATDQIGTPRPQGGGCDIGAIERPAGGAAQQDDGTSSRGLSTCTLTTTHELNFRDGPDGTRIGAVRKNATLTATARAAGWFQVEYRGSSGWISADYVVAQGVCG